MKVGIVTFFSVPNYGAMLQAYALWKYLEGRGHEVEFIDYAFGNTRRIPLWKCFVARHWHNCIDTIRKKLKFYVRFDGHAGRVPLPLHSAFDFKHQT